MEGTSTLADALLDDLDDLSDVEVERKQEDEVEHPEQSESSEQQQQQQYAWWPQHQKRLLDDVGLQKHVNLIREYMEKKPTSTTITKEQQEADHRLLVQSNQYLITAANDLTTAHASLCAAYETKFPELEELLPDATQYVKAVRTIGNETDLTTKTVNDGLNAFLTNHQIITLSVSGSTTAGRPLNSVELQKVDEIATYMESIMEIRALLTTFIEQQMEGLAPSMCALLGAATAAKLISLTGGLEALSKIPSCNLQVIGQVRHSGHSRAGVATGATQPHQGVLADCDLVQRCPRHLRRKALKMVADKLALVIRCDFTNVNTGRPRTAEHGRSFRDLIEKKFVQLQEPDKAPVLKALPKYVLNVVALLLCVCSVMKLLLMLLSCAHTFLPAVVQQQSGFGTFMDRGRSMSSWFLTFVLSVLLYRPDLTVKKRRGGKRMRRLKERYEETTLMKQANTRAFSSQAGEYGDDAMGKTLGLLDTTEVTAGGALRKNTAEKRKMKYANTRSSRKKAAQMNASAKTTSGLASSMVFTPVQGMELVNPDANKERVKEANRKWFSDNAGFQSALPKK